MKLLISVIVTLFIAACAHKEKPQPIPDAPIVLEPGAQLPVNAVKAQIMLAASTSGAAQYSFKGRGKAPVSYLKGMSLVYARAYCAPHKVAGDMILGSEDKDALKYYNIVPSNKNTYAFLIGLGMRESSGKYCEGRDLSANNVTATTAEAGMFQTSFNSSSAHQSLKDMLTEYHQECYLEVFKEGITCSQSSSTIYGSGPGRTFQEMARQCPAFAAEYAAITLRTLRKHYGPINRKEVEFRPEVVALLTEVEKIIDQNPSACAAL